MIIEITTTIRIDRTEDRKGKLLTDKELEAVLSETADLCNAVSSRAAERLKDERTGSFCSSVKHDEPEITVRFTDRPPDGATERRRLW